MRRQDDMLILCLAQQHWSLVIRINVLAIVDEDK
jgi:hypothetical protein